MANFFENLGSSAISLLNNGDFINRSIGMTNSYDDITMIVQALGHEPVSLLGKDYLYIFDHVRRNYNAGTYTSDVYSNDCPKFTFYKEKPTVRFANPYNDPMNYLGNWMPEVEFETTMLRSNGDGITYHYSESNDGKINNKQINYRSDVDGGNPGVANGSIASFGPKLNTCDLIKKTNDNFNYGKYRTLISRFHTNSMDSKDEGNPTQTAISSQFGMSHGRNLLKINKTEENGYDNPYCRVWTYHHQYNQLSRAIRPFGDANSQEILESMEVGDYNTVGFRTIESKEFGFKGGSSRLDKYGVLNYKNGLVNIAPTAKIKDYFLGKENDEKAVSIKKCMFSIENLAWKSDNIIHNEYDKYGLSPEQKGPLGGRIMWFPPYDLTFNEDVTVNWNSNQFIGRGENVYTYTNTERRGSISFTILIDHPSILDYWTGHNRNGMTNQGVPLINGNSGGVDELNNQENTLLRFFAGCEILSAKPQEFEKRNNPPKNEAQEDGQVDVPPETPVHGAYKHKSIHCVLYYPNNYSGVDDVPTKKSGDVNAIYYLMNGIGAQKYVKPCKCTKCGYEWYPENDDKETLSGVTAVCPSCSGTAMVNLTEEDIPTQIKHKINGGSNGGYEINGNISITKENVEPNYNIITSKTYADAVTSHKRGQYLTNGGSICEISPEDGNLNSNLSSYRLAKMVYSGAMSMSGANTPSNLTGDRHLWYRNRWFYRVDKAYENSRLSNPNEHIDTISFDLNCKGGYKKNSDVLKEFGIDVNDENVKLISFADIFVALEDEDAKGIIGNGNYNQDNVNTVLNIKNNRERFKITSIKFEGHASFQGHDDFNDELSLNRGNTFKNWMVSRGFPNAEQATVTSKKQDNKDNTDSGHNNDLVPKMWRSASLIIEYDEETVENAATAENVRQNENGEITTERVEIQNDTTSKDIYKYRNALEASKKWVDSYQENIHNAAMVGINVLKKGGEANGNNSNESTKTNDNKVGIVERYDNEGEFFELLEKNDPFMHHLICEKIRYFDPAFHSISPEGFNARLTFLHQCTRQGSTVGNSDNLPGTAYNLAFGRPPVCVLRLGDFFNTKIIINTLNIQYENAQWDLNPEGIGVMPMFAKITLGFVFLGGSDLSGPISRLQNAVSFNYYANTGVYDNRAEMVQYDDDGNGHEVKFKPYSYPNMVYTNGVIKNTTNTPPPSSSQKLTPIIEVEQGGMGWDV